MSRICCIIRIVILFEGAGNHYCEIQVVEEIFDDHAARKMGVDRLGQVCVMIHSGSRGLGHQVATDSLTKMEIAMNRDGKSPSYQ